MPNYRMRKHDGRWTISSEGGFVLEFDSYEDALDGLIKAARLKSAEVVPFPTKLERYLRRHGFTHRL